jgi:hypothetical protein
VDARQINIHLGSNDITQLKCVVKQLKELNALSDDNPIDKAITNGIDNVIDVPIGNGISNVIDAGSTEKVGCGEEGGTLLSNSETPSIPPNSISDNHSDEKVIPIVESKQIDTSTAPPDGT